MIIFFHIIIYLISCIQIYTKSGNKNPTKKTSNNISNDVCNHLKIMDIIFNKKNIGLCMNLNFTTKNFLIVFFLIFGSIILFSLIYSFYQVPYWRGYKCRCCQRTKWFFKMFIWIIFLPCILIYHLINGLFGCLDGMFPDTKLKDAKLDDSEEYEVKKPKKKNDNFHQLNEEEEQNQNI